MRLNPVSRFFWHIIIWLPLCFAAWYYMAILMTVPVNWLSGFIMPGLFPDWIESIVQQGHSIEVITQFSPAAEANVAVPAGQTAQLSFDINVLKYSYGIPLYTALILASPGGEETKLTRWIIGMAILYLTQAWGVCFEILLIIFYKLGADVTQQLGIAGLQGEMVALGYQLGYLILPGVTPLMLWIGFHREFLSQLVPGAGKPG